MSSRPMSSLVCLDVGNLIRVLTARHCLLEVSSALEYFVQPRIDSELASPVHDVGEGENVGDQRDNRHDQIGVRVIDRLRGEHRIILEGGNNLSKHAPQGERKCPVLNPAAFIPQQICHRRSQ